MLDTDRDHHLNIINLTFLFRNLPSNSRLGQELYRAVEFLIERDLHEKSLLTKVKIDLDTYLKINKLKMCLSTEIRTFFLNKPDRNFKLPQSLDSDSQNDDDYFPSKHKNKLFQKPKRKPCDNSQVYVSCVAPTAQQ